MTKLGNPDPLQGHLSMRQYGYTVDVSAIAIKTTWLVTAFNASLWVRDIEVLNAYKNALDLLFSFHR